MKGWIAAALALLALPEAARAGAWTQPAGGLLVINSLSYYQVNVVGYNTFGRPSGHGTYQQVEFAPYIEYGLNGRVTIGMQPRVQYVVQSGLPGTKDSFGLVQLNLFVRYLLLQAGPNVFSVQGTIGIPGTATADEPLLAQPNAEYEARLLYGRGFDLPNGWHGFANAELGYRIEANGWADQIRGDVTFGLNVTPDWMLLAQSFNTISVGQASPGGSDYSLYRVEFSAVHSFTPHISLQFGAWHDAGGHKIALGNAGIVALWFRN
jgi:protein XagA